MTQREVITRKILKSGVVDNLTCAQRFAYRFRNVMKCRLGKPWCFRIAAIALATWKNDDISEAEMARYVTLLNKAPDLIPVRYIVELLESVDCHVELRIRYGRKHKKAEKLSESNS